MSDVNNAVRIRQDVNTAVKAASVGGEPRKRVVDHLVEVELERRTKLLSSALTIREEVSKDIQKIERSPGHKVYSLAESAMGCVDLGQPVTAGFTEQQIKELNKLRLRLGKIDESIDKALNVNNPDFSGLEKLGD